VAKRARGFRMRYQIESVKGLDKDQK